ncbi:hypothetical protein RUMGNA_01359 [Mediterraneibacter gnavus ATCC 29149]|uniref:Uncharacterized protein n=1 Tax=Mediterraneibacter gnavus (strain ATCC 29149 / DSM 114966 / JCM 6515 / VPI C7-9) TaxID=411470 RepID=A7B1D4_MEDG7|nr:hypothetical protein RUMGNA_01359 [Mediterraneibacter gnavus ATCC 29149]
MDRKRFFIVPSYIKNLLFLLSFRSRVFEKLEELFL